MPFFIEISVALILITGWLGRPTVWWQIVWLVVSLPLIGTLAYSQAITHPHYQNAAFYAERVIIILWIAFGLLRWLTLYLRAKTNA